MNVPSSNLVSVRAEDLARASFVEVIANAVHVRGLLGRSSPSLAIAGGGALGLLTLLIARRAGVETVLLSEPNEGRRRTALELGATAVSDPRERSLAELASDLSGGGAAASVDAVGIAATRRDAIAATVTGGRVVMLGLEEENSAVEWADVVRREIDIRCFAAG